jgi:electron transfer flavoprotein alpha subunit
MTEASTGLRKALARGQKVTAEALAALSAEELIAGISADQMAAVAAAHAAKEADPAASEAEDDDETDTTMGDKKKSKDKEKDYMDDKAIAEAKKIAGVGTGFETPKST